LLAADSAEDFLSSVHIDASSAKPDLVGFTLSASLAGGPAVTAGDVTLGITAGQQVSISNYSAMPDTTLLTDAVRQAMSGLAVPRNLGDLASLTEGDICRVEGQGTLKFAVSVTYNFLNNTLASEPIELISQTLSVKAQSGPTVAVSVEHSNTHRLTIAALGGNKVRLGASLAAEAKTEADLSFSLGVTAGAGGFDGLAFILEQISPKASSELIKIRQAVPTQGQDALADQIKEVMESAMKGGIQACVLEALSKSKETDRLFTYEVDLSALDQPAKNAVQAALRGDFTQLTVSGSQLKGVREIDTLTTTTLTAKRALTIHLLGILNFSDVSSFIQKAKVGLNPQTGEMVLTSTDVKIIENNIDADHLREALFRSAMITTAAVSSPQNPDFTYKIVFFDRKARPSRSDTQQFSNVLQAVGSPVPPELGRTGAGAIYLSLKLNKTLSLALFHQRSTGDFVRAGQRALKTILTGDDSAANRIKLADIDPETWKEISNQGSRDNVLRMLATRGITDPAAPTDFYSIDWWAQAMGKVADALAHSKPLQEAEKDALKKSQGGFDTPWALLATYYMLQPQASVEAQFTVTPAMAAAPAS
jgi:hypothetical protein